MIELYGGLDFLELVSPVNYVETNSPPTCLFYSGTDPLVPLSQGAIMANRLTENGVPNTFKEYVGLGHSLNPLEIEDSWSIYKSYVRDYFTN